MPSWLRYGLLIGGGLLMLSMPLAMHYDGSSMEGFITDDAGPVAQASVVARELVKGHSVSGVSDTAGYYKLELAPGRYSLWVQAPKHAGVWIPKVTVETAANVRYDVYLTRIADPSGSIR